MIITVFGTAGFSAVPVMFNIVLLALYKVFEILRDKNIQQQCNKSTFSSMRLDYLSLAS